jgi:hypothetical protein
MPLTVYIPAVTIANVASNFMIVRWMTDTMELNNNKVLLLCVCVCVFFKKKAVCFFKPTHLPVQHKEVKFSGKKAAVE